MHEGHVIKIGGSLFDAAGEIIRDIISSGSPVIVVPGGGPFIELTAGCGIGDEESHWMAIAGMEQYGWYLSSFGIPVVDRLELQQNQAVLLPYRIMRDKDPLPHTWNVTRIRSPHGLHGASAKTLSFSNRSMEYTSMAGYYPSLQPPSLSGRSIPASFPSFSVITSRRT